MNIVLLNKLQWLSNWILNGNLGLKILLEPVASPTLLHYSNSVFTVHCHRVSSSSIWHRHHGTSRPGAVVRILFLARSAMFNNNNKIWANNIIFCKSWDSFGHNYFGNSPVDLWGAHIHTHITRIDNKLLHFITVSSVCQAEVFTGAYSEVALWFNWRPVGVTDWFPIGPFHGVLIPQTNPHTGRASLEQHGDVGCRNDGMTTGKQKQKHSLVFLSDKSKRSFLN